MNEIKDKIKELIDKEIQCSLMFTDGKDKTIYEGKLLELTDEYIKMKPKPLQEIIEGDTLFKNIYLIPNETFELSGIAEIEGYAKKTTDKITLWLEETYTYYMEKYAEMVKNTYRYKNLDKLSQKIRIISQLIEERKEEIKNE